MELESMNVGNFFVDAMLMKLPVEITGPHILGSLVFDTCIEVSIVNLDTGCHCLVAELEASSSHERLRVARIRLVAHTLIIQPNNFIKDTNLFVAILTFSEPPFEFQVKGLRQPLLILEQAIAWPEGREIIAVDHERD